MKKGTVAEAKNTIEQAIKERTNELHKAMADAEERIKKLSPTENNTLNPSLNHSM